MFDRLPLPSQFDRTIIAGGTVLVLGAAPVVVVLAALLIVDPKTDRVVNAGRETALADARSLSPQGLADWLAQWV